MTKPLLLLLTLLAAPLFGVGTVTVTRETRSIDKYWYSAKRAEVVTIAWTADASAATVPTTDVDLYGYVQKVITNPGSTAPTANYDIDFKDPEDSALDAFALALNNRHTTTTEQVYPMIAGAPGTVTSRPVFLAGTYAFTLTNNAVNSATGRVLIYLTDQH